MSDLTGSMKISTMGPASVTEKRCEVAFWWGGVTVLGHIVSEHHSQDVRSRPQVSTDGRAKELVVHRALQGHSGCDHCRTAIA